MLCIWETVHTKHVVTMFLPSKISFGVFSPNKFWNTQINPRDAIWIFLNKTTIGTAEITLCALSVEAHMGNKATPMSTSLHCREHVKAPLMGFLTPFLTRGAAKTCWGRTPPLAIGRCSSNILSMALTIEFCSCGSSARATGNIFLYAFMLLLNGSSQILSVSSYMLTSTNNNKKLRELMALLEQLSGWFFGQSHGAPRCWSLLVLLLLAGLLWRWCNARSSRSSWFRSNFVFPDGGLLTFWQIGSPSLLFLGRIFLSFGHFCLLHLQINWGVSCSCFAILFWWDGIWFSCAI